MEMISVHLNQININAVSVVKVGIFLAIVAKS